MRSFEAARSLTSRTVALSAIAAAASCVGQIEPPPSLEGGRVAIEVAPLSLDGVTDADYTVRVTNGADGAGEVVWERSGLRSAQFGDGAGSLSYVGPCDADAGTNSITLTLVALYEGNGVPISEDTYRNPGALVKNVQCLEDADVGVDFDITIARDAQQGFFDIVVDFDDIFCAAKLDCEHADHSDLDLLHDPDTQARDMTAVLGFACTADPSLDQTYLYMDDIRIVCDGVDYDPVTIDPTGLGNIDTDGSGSSDPEGYLFAASVTRGSEALAGKAYWNVSLGLNEAEFTDAGDCFLSGRATASSSAWTQTTSGFPLPEGSIYPIVEWNVQLSNSTARVCTSHAVNVPGSDVETVYDGYLPPLNAFTWSDEVVYLDARFDAKNDEVLRATPCGSGLVPDGAGGCVECVTATDCPDDADACTERTCVANVCGFDPITTGACGFTGCGDVLVDARDGQSYDTVQIGAVCWMRENLNHGTFIQAPNTQDPSGPATKWCYADVESNCDAWGGQYTYANAVRGNVNQQTQGICPTGWRLPTAAEWQNVRTIQGSNIFTVSETTLSLLFSGRYSSGWHYGTDCAVSQYVQTHHWWSQTGSGGYFWMFGNCPVPPSYGGTSAGQLTEGRAVRCVLE